MTKREAMRHALSHAAALVASVRFTSVEGRRLVEGEDDDWDRLDEARRHIAQRLAERAGETEPGMWEPD